jgi:hypothetical protein
MGALPASADFASSFSPKNVIYLALLGLQSGEINKMHPKYSI